MSEIIERVARASFKHWRESCDRLGVHMDKLRTFEEMPDDERAFAFSHARIVIEAMREPTDAMSEAGAEEAPDYTRPHSSEMPPVWRAMIDAALKE